MLTLISTLRLGESTSASQKPPRTPKVQVEESVLVLALVWVWAPVAREAMAPVVVPGVSALVLAPVVPVATVPVALAPVLAKADSATFYLAWAPWVHITTTTTTVTGLPSTTDAVAAAAAAF